MGPLVQLGVRARRGFARVVPDPLVIAIGLTVLVLFAAALRGTPLLDVIAAWSGGKGLWSLLKFTMQMCAMLVLGSALAATPSVGRLIDRAAAWPRGPRQLVGLCAATSIALALLNWSLCIVGGALFARAAGRVATRRGYTLHYPLVCAAAYSGMMAWHGGLSGSAPLKATTAADMTEVLGAELAARAGVIPLSETILSPLNLWVSGGLLVLGPLLFMAMTPREGHDPEATRAPAQRSEPAPAEPVAPGSAVERFERSPIHLWLLATLLGAALAVTLSRRGFSALDFNTVNLALWCLAMVGHGELAAFVRACEAGVRGCTGIILQFPLYAGIMGIMTASGLSSALSQLFAEAGAGALTVVGFAAAGLLNLFVPSGGGQWAVQGPILIEGALSLGVPPAKVLLAVAYGDQWTNMLQPFWALPLLAITGVRARDIVGYTTIWMIVGGVWMGASLWAAT